jgi:hypothetical protein
MRRCLNEIAPPRQLNRSGAFSQHMSKSWTYLIAILEIVGGIWGIAFVVWQSWVVPLDRYTFPFAVIIFVVYSLSLAAGIALALGRKFGRVGSIAVQAIQLPKYGSQLLVFMFSFGFDAYVYGMFTNNAQAAFGIEFKFLAFNQLFVNVTDAPVMFGISIPACGFLVMLLRNPKIVHSDDVPPMDADAPNKPLDASGGSVFRN